MGGEKLLFKAIRKNNLEKVKELMLREDLDLSKRINNQTALYLACQKGYVEIVMELLKQPNLEVNKGYYNDRKAIAAGIGGSILGVGPVFALLVGTYPPLWVACKGNNVNVVRELLYHPDINVEKNEPITVTKNVEIKSMIRQYEYFGGKTYEINRRLTLASMRSLKEKIENLKLKVEEKDRKIHKLENEEGIEKEYVKIEFQSSATKSLPPNPRISIKPRKKTTPLPRHIQTSGGGGISAFQEDYTEISGSMPPFLRRLKTELSEDDDEDKNVLLSRKEKKEEEIELAKELQLLSTFKEEEEEEEEEGEKREEINIEDEISEDDDQEEENEYVVVNNNKKKKKKEEGENNKKTKKGDEAEEEKEEEIICKVEVEEKEEEEEEEEEEEIVCKVEEEEEEIKIKEEEEEESEKWDGCKRYAYLVGQNQGQLKGCVYDSERMERRLKTFGYKCTRANNVTYADFAESYQNFLSDIIIQEKSTEILSEEKQETQTQTATRVFFYYSGHGCEISGKTYLMCFMKDNIGMNMELGEVLRGLNHLKVKNCEIVCVIDACRYNEDNRVWKNGGGGGGGSMIMNTPQIGHFDKKFVLGFSCASGRKSEGGRTERELSLYTRELLSSMKKGISVMKVLTVAGERMNSLNRVMGVNPENQQIAWVNCTAKAGVLDFCL